MTERLSLRREAALTIRYTGTSLIGFCVDFGVLHLLHPVLEPAFARVVSLLCAMHVTFVINGLKVFRCLELRQLPRQWAGYMAANGFGNICNYWIFVTLVSTHWRIIGSQPFALAVGSLAAWTFNFAATRWLVFHRPQSGPSPTAPGSSHP